ncbi:MAG: biotin/lipoyl-binding protein [Parvularculaceae bacterium]
MRKRPRSDTHANQARKPGGNVGRTVYLCLLSVFALALANYLWGDLLILRSDGLVLRDQTVVAAPYVSRVEEVHVKEGQSVERGDVLMRVKSAEVLERLADLSVRQAELTIQTAETLLRYNTAVQLLPMATKREKETTGFTKRLEETANRAAITSPHYEQALSASYAASQDRIRLSTESQTLQEQIQELQEARASAAAAVEDLNDMYEEGEFRAATSGSVGAEVPNVGTVYRAGEPFLSLYSGDSYVLAYLPRRYLFSIKPGMKVVIAGGRRRANGVVAEILTVTDALPQEFQITFKPRDRNQLAKVRLTEPANLLLFEKVRITRQYF